MKKATNEARRAPRRAAQAAVPAELTTTILESISEGVFTVDRAWRVTSFNRAAERITGIARREALGRLCAEVFRSNMCETACALRATVATGKPMVGRTGYIINAAGERVPVSITTAVLRDARGRVMGGAETFRDLSEVTALRAELAGRFHCGAIVSRSPLMQRIFDVIPSIAASPATVLILGETGTGKELMARTIHDESPRRGGPFIAVNCAALPDTLLESELFGYKKGAFTGAVRNKPGRFALANGGTLLLDEIGSISPAMQVRLLRVLQERSYEPLGATRPERTDVRIIAATNTDLAEAMRRGAFREDLYYRLNVVRIELPPLRRRAEDIPQLVMHFIERFNRLHGKAVHGIAPDALALLMAHDWPGNVRELENYVERAFVMCQGDELTLAEVPAELRGEQVTRAVPTLRGMRAASEAKVIEQTVARCEGNRAAAARALGMHKTTLHRKIKELRLALPPARRGRRAGRSRGC